MRHMYVPLHVQIISTMYIHVYIYHQFYWCTWDLPSMSDMRYSCQEFIVVNDARLHTVREYCSQRRQRQHNTTQLTHPFSLKAVHVVGGTYRVSTILSGLYDTIVCFWLQRTSKANAHAMKIYDIEDIVHVHVHVNTAYTQHVSSLELERHKVRINAI